jgi:hypothetical protein
MHDVTLQLRATEYIMSTVSDWHDSQAGSTQLGRYADPHPVRPWHELSGHCTEEPANPNQADNPCSTQCDTMTIKSQPKPAQTPHTLHINHAVIPSQHNT